jgi:hypothetical protein
VDLQSGLVLGLHTSGRWQGDKSGKFAYAESFSKILADPDLPVEVRNILQNGTQTVATP